MWGLAATRPASSRRTELSQFSQPFLMYFFVHVVAVVLRCPQVCCLGHLRVHSRLFCSFPTLIEGAGIQLF